MASYKCGSCGNVLRPIPKCKCGLEMVIGEVDGIPSLICPEKGENCTSEPLPKCCSFPAYSRWI